MRTREGGEEEREAGNRYRREDCQPNTPIAEKIRKFDIKSGLEGKGSSRKKSIGRKKEGPKWEGKDRMIQPTLSSFMNIKCRPKGNSDKAGPSIVPSRNGSLEPIGKGLEPGPEEGGLSSFGEGRRKSWRIVEGSPEHHLYKEAQIVQTEGGSSPRLKEAGLGVDSGSKEGEERKASASGDGTGRKSKK